MALLLAADIGGTKSNLLLFEQDAGLRRVRREATLRSAEHLDAISVVRKFVGTDTVAAAAIAIAGPVVDGRAETPNLPWVVEQREIARTLGIDRVELLNDLAATAYGVRDLGPQAWSVINEGIISPGLIAVIAAGTGLGEAAVVESDTGPIALPSEGGHADFAPGDETEIELLRWLAARYGHVSWERVVSGPGLQAIYQFLLDSGRGSTSNELAARMKTGDASAVISEAGLARSDPTASLALDIFVRAYGAEAGNLALKTFALGGVYVAGGIAPKILDRSRSGTFMRGFLGKGRYSNLLSRVPVRVVLDPKTALRGASLRAARLSRA